MEQSNGRNTGVSVGLTRNLGNFNSARFEAWETLPISDDENAAQVRKELFEKLKDELRQEVKELEK